jgi:hypothetical protein
MWTLSLLCALVGSATNLFFSLRYPSVTITPVIALVVVHPLGRTWDRFLKCHDDPIEDFESGTLGKPSDLREDIPWKRRMRLWLAQGRWNEKEHACVYVSSNVSFGFAFATDVRAVDGQCVLASRLIILGHRGTNEILQTRSQHHVSAFTHHFYPNTRLLVRRSNTPIFSQTPKHDLARDAHVNRHVYDHA